MLVAYGDSPYLKPCLDSLKAQSIPAQIEICTSTPSELLREIADEYNVPMHVNAAPPGIASDWNFALNQCCTDFVTLAHQDDIYERDYLETCLKCVRDCPDFLMLFTANSDLIDGRVVNRRLYLGVKRFITRLFFLRSAQLRSRFMRRWLLSFGNPVSCPSVMLHWSRLKPFAFGDRFKINLDWEAWLRLARREGCFVYNSRRLVQHRIHAQSENIKAIGGELREEEDLEVFSQLYPRTIARLLNWVYRLGTAENRT